MEIMTSEQLSELMQKANAGDPEAQFKVGECYQKGNDVPKDLISAAGWYEKAAKQGHGHAQTRLGTIYCELGKNAFDKETKKENEDEYDFAEAKRYLEIAGNWLNTAKANGFNAVAGSLLVDVENAKYKIRVIEDDRARKKHHREMESAARHGDPEAQCWLADLYYKGKDYVNAVEWYKIAAEKGHAKAQYELAMCYYYKYGVERDYEAAIKWMRKAADQGYLDAMKIMGNLYRYGGFSDFSKIEDPNIKVEIDYRKALEWYKKVHEKEKDKYKYNTKVSSYEISVLERMIEKQEKAQKVQKVQEAQQPKNSEKYVDRSISYQVLGIVAALLLVGFTILFSYIGAGKGTEKVGGAFLGTILTFVCIAGIFVTGVASFALIGNNFSTATVIIGGILGIAGSIVVMTALADYPVIKKYVIYYAAAAVLINIIVIIFRKARRPKN